MSNVHRKPAWKYFGSLFAAAVILWLAWELLPVLDWARTLTEYVSQLGFWGPVIFWAIYVLAAVVGVPRTPLNVGAGIIFSYPVALAVVLISAFTAFLATFEIARHFARDWVMKKVKQFPLAQQIMELVEAEPFKMVFLVRINPFVPAALKGYGFGTTAMPLRTYLLASMLGFLPIAAAHVYLGWLGGIAMMQSEQHPDGMKSIILVGGAIVSIALVAVMSWYGQRSLKKRSAAWSAA